MNLRALLCLLSLLCCALPARAQDTTPAPQISVVTFGPGEIYWERFGHNALLVRQAGQERLYNYGIFDFQQKNFFLNFARGHMLYRLDVEHFRRALRMYHAEGRWAREQKLALGDAQARELAAFLAQNAQPDNAEYRYDYFRDNCSTRVRDALDRALGGVLKQRFEARPGAPSYRFEATRLIGPDLALAIGMDLGMGPSADAPLNLWQASFVPMTFMQALREARITDAAGERPLVASEAEILPAQLPEAPEQPPALLWPMLLMGLLLAAGLLLLGRLRARRWARYGFAALAATLSLLCGAGGLVLAASWALTEHWAMWRNLNLLLLNPLCLLLIPAWLCSARAGWQSAVWQRVLGATVLVGAVLSLLPLQHNLPWVALLLPLHAVLALQLRAKP